MFTYSICGKKLANHFTNMYSHLELYIYIFKSICSSYSISVVQRLQVHYNLILYKLSELYYYISSKCSFSELKVYGAGILYFLRIELIAKISLLFGNL